MMLYKVLVRGVAHAGVLRNGSFWGVLLGVAAVVVVVSVVRSLLDD